MSEQAEPPSIGSILQKQETIDERAKDAERMARLNRSNQEESSEDTVKSSGSVLKKVSGLFSRK